MNLTPWLTKGGQHLRARALWAAVFALIALFWRFSVPGPPPRTAEGVAAMLGSAVGGEVRPDDFVWEERGGFVSDSFLGRRVLFLARRRGEDAGDLYRARVRLTRIGRPVSLLLLRNLTRSPRGDDRELIARGHHAAYVTMGDGVVQGITLLDLAGEGAAREARTVRERIGASIESWLSSGSAQGVGRTEITFGAPVKAGSALMPPAEVKVELAADLLVMALGKEALPAATDLRDGSLNTGPRNVFAARSQRIPHLARPLGEVAVDALRELVGPLPARALRVVVGSPQKSAPRGPLVVFPGRALPRVARRADAWPPPDISPQMTFSLPGEGLWAPPAGSAENVGETPPAFFETAIRPSRSRPNTLVRLVAIDMRQVDLRLEAGVDAPRAATGLRGFGRLPAEEPVVAAFTAGPAEPPMLSSPRMAPGFVVDRRVLLPPSPGVASVAIFGDGHLSFGSWPFGAELPAEIVSLAQTPDPLVGGDGRARIPLQADGALAERSALCQLASGHVIYAWGADVSPEMLAGALSMAGCIYAVPLAASPAKAGFAYVHGQEAALLAPEMSLSPGRLMGSPNALFYAVRRDPRPSSSLPANDAGAAPKPPGGEWAPDAGEQPAPAWIPSIYSAVAANLGAQIHLTSFAPGRMVFRLRAGGKEPATKAAASLPGALAEAEQSRALAAIGIGAGKKRGARGLTIEGAVGYPLRGEGAGILVISKGKIEIATAAGFTLPPGADATELPLTADEGKLRPEAREVGSMRPRAVACVLPDGTFVIGGTTFDSDEAATGVLLELGCTRVVALDRGAHQSAFLHRAGTETKPSVRYESSAIYAVDAPLTGRARGFGGD